MAASVSSSNSFLLTTTYRSKLRNSKNPRQLTVFAKKTPTSSETETRTNPFQFDWGKISDVKSLIPSVRTPPAFGGPGRQKDSGTVFVAGATGLAGVHIAQMLLREGYKVRAGVPDLGAAQELARFALDYKIISAEELKRLNAVESLFEDAESIAKAMGNASKVVVTIGSAENGPAKKVTTSDALQVVEAAQLAGVRHMAIIYDDSAGAPTSPSSVLEGISSFFNNIFSKSKPLSVTELIEKVVQTDVKFTFIKTALTEEFSPESTYNVVVAAEGREVENDYKVSRSRMAGLVAQLFSNTEVAEDKVVEVYTEPSAPSKSVEQLFSAIPEDGRRKAYAEAAAKAEAEEAAVKAAEQAREAEKVKTQLEEEVKKLSEQESRASSLAEEAKLKAEQAGASVDSLLAKAKGLGSGFSWDKLSSQLATAVKTPESGTEKVQVATVRGQAKARNLASQKAVVKPASKNSKPKSKPAPKERTATEKSTDKEVRNIFGGLFKQETIYVDDV
ncbi:protein PLASTID TRANSCRIPTIONALLY ACTIVE 16, chloroplastic [Silene latifolia]|uniref:protein PLASTID TRANSCRIPTIONALLY ACTIVE 16, chloroplastic n=1 Tax=Silene latifolia TaxID=37657 RepID=UPI003D77312A